jgi:hypothetical protein
MQLPRFCRGFLWVKKWSCDFNCPNNRVYCKYWHLHSVRETGANITTIKTGPYLLCNTA